jgi:hypothetical protein
MVRLRKATTTLLIAIFPVCFMKTVWAADPPRPGSAPDSPATISSDELARLKVLLAAQENQLQEQREQMERLRTTLELQTQLLEKVSTAFRAEANQERPHGNLLASSVPAVSPAPAAPARRGANVPVW